jgi:hypothetical protein
VPERAQPARRARPLQRLVGRHVSVSRLSFSASSRRAAAHERGIFRSTFADRLSVRGQSSSG